MFFGITCTQLEGLEGEVEGKRVDLGGRVSDPSQSWKLACFRDSLAVVARSMPLDRCL